MQYFDVLYVSRNSETGERVRYGVLSIQAQTAINARVYACSILACRGQVMVDGQLCHFDTLASGACGNFDHFHGKAHQEAS